MSRRPRKGIRFLFRTLGAGGEQFPSAATNIYCETATCTSLATSHRGAGRVFVPAERTRTVPERVDASGSVVATRCWRSGGVGANAPCFQSDCLLSVPRPTVGSLKSEGRRWGPLRAPVDGSQGRTDNRIRSSSLGNSRRLVQGTLGNSAN